MRSAFSLIELSIVVAILSLVSVMGLEVATSFITTRAYEATQVKVADVDTAIRNFYWVNGRFPCPADRTFNPYNINYGLEDCTVTQVDNMLVGAVPFRTLNLPLNASLDSYNNKINYYVTQTLTSTVTFNNNNGVIQIRSGKLEATCTSLCTTISSDVAYAVFSNGADKRGARTKQGVLLASCATNGDMRIDSRNCMAAAGGGPTSPSISGVNILYDSRYNPGLIPANYFDDAIVWRRKGQL